MKKQSLIAIIIVLVLIILGGGVYILTQQQKDTTPLNTTTALDTSATDTPTVADNTAETPITQNTLRDILASGKSLTCTFSQDDGDGIQQGTTYIDTGRVRADITVRKQDDTIKDSHVILNDGWAYTWGAAFDAKKGLKMKTVITATSTADSNNFVYPDQHIDYHCTLWHADNSVFETPKDITFKEFSLGSQMFQPTTGASNTAVDCSVCDQAPGADAQAQCRTALGCE